MMTTTLEISLDRETMQREFSSPMTSRTFWTHCGYCSRAWLQHRNREFAADLLAAVARQDSIFCSSI